MATGRAAFNVKIDFTQADALGSKLDRVTQRALLRLSAADAVNEVATRFDAQAKKGMNAGVNLSDQYIRERMSLVPARAVGTQPVKAEIIAAGRLTILSRYPYAQLTTSAPRAKGDPKRGVPAGKKQAGVAVEIVRGQAFEKDKWFTMTLRRGREAGDNVGVFSRGEKGILEHMHGPSVYSLFRYQINQRQDDLFDDLAATGRASAEAVLRKELS